MAQRPASEQAGTVGQEIYGAAAPFVIATRHCFPVKAGSFTLHCNYPITDFESTDAKGGGEVSFRVMGDRRCSCQVRVVPSDHSPLPTAELLLNGGTKRATKPRDAKPRAGRLTELGYVEFDIPGDAIVTLRWKHTSNGHHVGSNGHSGTNGASSIAKRVRRNTKKDRKEARG